MKLAFSRFRTTQIVVGLVCFAAGFIMVTQFRVQRSTGELTSLSEQDLGQIINEVNGGINTLQTDLAAYRIRLMKYQQEASDQKIILNQAAQNLDELNILAGSSKVTGPGTAMKITDTREVLRSYDFIDLVSELRSAGAEAVSINDQRVSLQSYFEDKKDQIALDGHILVRPYTIISIGDSQTLYQAVIIKGGILESFNSLKGVSVDIQEQSELILPPYAKKHIYQYLSPVGE